MSTNTLPRGAVPYSAGIPGARRPAVSSGRPIGELSPVSSRPPIFYSPVAQAQYRASQSQQRGTVSTGSGGSAGSGTPASSGSSSASAAAASSGPQQGVYYYYAPNASGQFQLIGTVSTSQTAASGQSWQNIVAQWQAVINQYPNGAYISFIPNGGANPNAGQTVYAIYAANGQLEGTTTNPSGLGNYTGGSAISSIKAIGYVPATVSTGTISPINQLSQAAPSKAQGQAFQAFNQAASQINQTQVQTGISTGGSNPPTTNQYIVQYSGNTYYFDTYQQAASTLQYLTTGAGNPGQLYSVSGGGATVYFSNSNVANGFATVNALQASQSSITPVSIQTGISVSGGGGTNAQGPSYTNAYSVTLPGGQLVYYASQAEVQQALAAIAQGQSPSIYQVQTGSNTYQYFGDQSLANTVAAYQQDSQIKYSNYIAGLGGPGYTYTSGGQTFVSSSELNLINTINSSINNYGGGGISAYNVAGVNYVTQSNAQQAYANLVLPNEISVSQSKSGGYNLNYNGSPVTSTPFATQAQAQAAAAQYQSYAAGTSTNPPAWINFNGQTYTSSAALSSALNNSITNTSGGNYSLNIGGSTLVFNSLSQAQQAIAGIVSGNSNGLYQAGNYTFATSAAANQYVTTQEAYGGAGPTGASRSLQMNPGVTNYYNQAAITSAQQNYTQQQINNPTLQPGTIQGLKSSESMLSWFYGGAAGTMNGQANVAQIRVNNLNQLALSNPSALPGTTGNLRTSENVLSQGLSGIGKASTPSQIQLQNQYIRLVSQRAALTANPNASDAQINAFNSNVASYNANVTTFNKSQQSLGGKVSSSSIFSLVSAGENYLNGITGGLSGKAGADVTAGFDSLVSGFTKTNTPTVTNPVIRSQGGRFGFNYAAGSTISLGGATNYFSGQANSLFNSIASNPYVRDIGAVGAGIETGISAGPIGQTVRGIQNLPVNLNNVANYYNSIGYGAKGQAGVLSPFNIATGAIGGFAEIGSQTTRFLNPNASYKNVYGNFGEGVFSVEGFAVQGLGLGEIAAGADALIYGGRAAEAAVTGGRAAVSIGQRLGQAGIGAGIGALYGAPSGNLQTVATDALLFGGVTLAAEPAIGAIVKAGRGISGGINNIGGLVNEWAGYPLSDVKSLGVLAQRLENPSVIGDLSLYGKTNLSRPGTIAEGIGTEPISENEAFTQNVGQIPTRPSQAYLNRLFGGDYSKVSQGGFDWLDTSRLNNVLSMGKNGIDTGEEVYPGVSPIPSSIREYFNSVDVSTPKYGSYGNLYKSILNSGTPIPDISVPKDIALDAEAKLDYLIQNNAPASQIEAARQDFVTEFSTSPTPSYMKNLSLISNSGRGFTAIKVPDNIALDAQAKFDYLVANNAPSWQINEALADKISEFATSSLPSYLRDISLSNPTQYVAATEDIIIPESIKTKGPSAVLDYLRSNNAPSSQIRVAINDLAAEGREPTPTTLRIPTSPSSQYLSRITNGNFSKVSSLDYFTRFFRQPVTPIDLGTETAGDITKGIYQDTGLTTEGTSPEAAFKANVRPATTNPSATYLARITSGDYSYVRPGEFDFLKGPSNFENPFTGQTASPLQKIGQIGGMRGNGLITSGISTGERETFALSNLFGDFGVNPDQLSSVNGGFRTLLKSFGLEDLAGEGEEAEGANTINENTIPTGRGTQFGTKGSSGGYYSGTRGEGGTTQGQGNGSLTQLIQVPKTETVKEAEVAAAQTNQTEASQTTSYTSIFGRKRPSASMFSYFDSFYATPAAGAAAAPVVQGQQVRQGRAQTQNPMTSQMNGLISSFLQQPAVQAQSAVTTRQSLVQRETQGFASGLTNSFLRGFQQSSQSLQAQQGATALAQSQQPAQASLFQFPQLSQPAQSSIFQFGFGQVSQFKYQFAQTPAYQFDQLFQYAQMPATAQLPATEQLPEETGIYDWIYGYGYDYGNPKLGRPQTLPLGIQGSSFDKRLLQKNEGFGLKYQNRRHRVSENISADIEASLGNIFRGYGIGRRAPPIPTIGKRAQTQKFTKRPAMRQQNMPRIGFNQTGSSAPNSNSLFSGILGGIRPVSAPKTSKKTNTKSKPTKKNNARRLGVNTSIIDGFLH